MKYLAIFVHFISSSALAGEWFLSCPEDIYNAGQCASYNEAILLKEYGSKVKRDGEVLLIGPIKGKTIELRDGEWSYYAVRYYEKADLLLVRIQYYEGNSYLIVDMKYGYQREIKGFPVFNADSSKFVVTDIDLEAQYNPNVLSVYTRNRASWKLEYYIAPTNWGPVKPVWVSNEKVKFFKKSWNKSFETFLIFEDGNWGLKTLNK